MENETKMKQDGGNGTVSSQTMYHYKSSNTTIKSWFGSNIPNLEDTVLTEEHPYDATTYKDLIKTLIKCVQQEYYAGVYLGQVIW